jgi:hypothetical protein
MSLHKLNGMKMKYTRENPSARYIELLGMYQDLHAHGQKDKGVAAEETFHGGSMVEHAGRIRELLQLTGSKTMLDYGCGKGAQYEIKDVAIQGEGKTYPTMQAFLGLDDVYRYDPAYKPFSTLPDKKFDAVICTDVLEHCSEDDMEWILDEIFSYSQKLVFANIASYPARKTLPNGENAHCTIKPLEWWQDLIGRVNSRHPGVAFVILYKTSIPDGDGFENKTYTLSNIAKA